MRAFQEIGEFVKPTTRFIQIFGTAATRAKLEIGKEQLQRLLEGQELPVDQGLGTGYVILTLGGHQVLGLGLLIDGRVRSQIPRKELRQPMLSYLGVEATKKIKA